MKKLIAIVFAASFIVAGCNHDEDHDHDHGHGHPHPHQEEKHKDHDKHDDHGHDHDKHKEHGHDHGKDEDHDHEKHEEHDHDKHGKHEEHGHDHGDHEDHLPGAVVDVPESSQKLIGLKTQRVQKRRIDSTVTLPGRFELAKNARTAYVTPLAGVLSYKVQSLAKVAAGDVLFTIASPDLVRREQEISVLEGRLENYRKSGAKNASLESELKLRRGELQALIGENEVKNGTVNVKATRDGIVEELELAGGAYAETGAKVLTAIDPAALRFKALVSPAEVAKLRDGMKVTLAGRIGSLRLAPADATGSAAAYVVFADPDPDWKSGVRGEVQCTVDSSEKEVLAVPSAAIVQVGVKPVVFVRDEDDDDHFIAFEVVTGKSGGGWTEIKNFPDDDEEVVIRGQYELKLALPSGEGGGKKAGHFHADGAFHESDE